MNNCPNCNRKISTGVWSANAFHEGKPFVLAINTLLGKTAAGYCGGCLTEELTKAKESGFKNIEQLKETITGVLTKIPIISSHSPSDWSYTTIGLVTAQTVIGTGLFTELASSINDLFGMQSNSMNSKLKEGENVCIAHLKKQALEMGANAILAADIDYNEVGGGKSMVMVCMTGTAVLIKDESSLSAYNTLMKELSNQQDLISQLT